MTSNSDANRAAQQRSNVRFLHIRQHTGEGEPTMFGGKTVAFTLSDSDEGRVMRFAVAKCGKKQAFNRKLGRTVAEGMLTCERVTSVEKHVKSVVLDDDSHPYDVLLGDLS